MASCRGGRQLARHAPHPAHRPPPPTHPPLPPPLLAAGGCQVYSNIRKFRDDLTVYPPDHFVCVPLVLDTLHGKVCERRGAGAE